MKNLLFILILCCSINGFGQIEIYDSLFIKKRIKSFSISPDKSLLVTSVGKKNPELSVYKLESKEKIKRLKIHKSLIRRIQFSPDGKYLATASTDNTVKILNTKEFNVIHTFHSSSDMINDLCFYDDDKLACSSKGGIITTWDLKKGKELNFYNTGYKYLFGLTYNSEESYFLISAYGKKEKGSEIFFLNDDLTIKQKRKIDYNCSIRYLPECNKILTLDEDKYIVREIDHEGNTLQSYNPHKMWIYSIIAIDHCKYYVSTSHDKRLKIYENEKCIYSLELRGKGFKIEKLSDTEFAFMDMKGAIRFIRVNN